MGQGAVTDRPDEHEGSRLEGPAQGPAQEVQHGVLQPAQAVAQGAARVVYVGQPGRGDGSGVDVRWRLGPQDERGAGKGSDSEYGVGGRVQFWSSLATGA